MAKTINELECMLEREKTARLICSELNNFVDIRNSLITVLKHIRILTGCEAVGIRLHADGDYPYFVYEGFPESFIQKENSLCARDKSGKLIPIPSADGRGYLLECMCGNIIQGRFDPKLSFFTPNGSFWSNNTTALLASSTKKDRLVKTRNYCNVCGYESVALIPLKSQGERVGLIQLNDKRVDMFNKELIEYVEMIGEQIGTAVRNSLIYRKSKQNEELMRSLFEYSPIEKTIVDRNGRIMMFNREKRNSGSRLPNIGDVMYKDYASRHERDMHTELMKCIRTGKTKEFPDLKYGDKYLLIKISPFTDGAIITAKDITKRKQAEEALKESNAFNESTLNTIDDIFYAFSRDGKFLRWNQTCNKVTGYSDAELSLKKPADFFSGRDVRRISDAIEKIWMEGNVKIEADFVLKNGRHVPYEFVSSALKDGIGNITGFVGIGRDLAERKLSEAALKEAYDKLELAHKELLDIRHSERLAFTGRIAASIAHEIRNPSTNVSLAIESLSSTFEPLGKQTKYVEIIEKNIKRINYLITEMLNCARPPELNMKPHNIHEILDDVLESVEAKIKAKEIRLIKEFTPAYSVIKMDKEHMARAFLNLILNAIESMSKKHGRLTIATENHEKSFLIKIKDTGKGIPEEDIIKIFDPFFSSKPSGVGLGLTTCYGVVVSHGGAIEVASKQTKGSTFTVSLPM